MIAERRAGARHFVTVSLVSGRARARADYAYRRDRARDIDLDVSLVSAARVTRIGLILAQRGDDGTAC